MDKKAFTLAEVLITLGIIGVVAALTMSSLIAKHQKKQTVVRLKKAYSLQAQAYIMSEVENASADGWPNLNDPNPAVIFANLNQYFFPYFKTIKTCSTTNLKECGVAERYYALNGGPAYASSSNVRAAAVLADGTTIFYTFNDVNRITTHIDVNGSAPPNRHGRDVFRIQDFYYNGRSGYYVAGQGLAREELMSGAAQYACNKSQEGYHCATLIMQDGWQIKDDYPW